MRKFRDDRDFLLLELVQGSLVMILVACSVLLDALSDGDPPHRIW